MNETAQLHIPSNVLVLEEVVASRRHAVAEQARRARSEEQAFLSPLPTLGLVDIEQCSRDLAILGGLSERERRILVPMLKGLENEDIAAEQGVARRTVKFHVSNILKKLRVSRRGELSRFFF